MRKIVWRRLASSLPILLAVATVSFVILRAIPGDFASAATSGSLVSADTLDHIRQSMGLDRPLLSQYLTWLGGLLRGDLGTSLVTSRPVATEVMGRAMVTLELTAMALVLGSVIGFSTGLLSALRPKQFGWVVRAFNGLGVAVPNFILATLVVLIFGLYLPDIPIFGYADFSVDPLQNIRSLLLPALTMAIALSVTISENLRSAVLEILNEDYVLVARAKGLKHRTVVWSYLVRNATIPVITVSGLQVATLVGGSILVETIFNIPGIGQLLFDRVRDRDYPVIQAIVILTSFLVILINIIIDLLYLRADARISYGR